MNNDTRDRWKAMKSVNKQSSKEDALFSAWDEQKKVQQEQKKQLLEAEKNRQRDRDLKKRQFKQGSSSFLVWLKKTTKVIFDWVSFGVRELIDLVKTNKWAKLTTGVVLLAIGSLVVLNIYRDDSSPATLGDSSSFLDIELPREDPTFSLMFPSGSSESDYDVVRLPGTSGEEQAFTYVDNHEPTGATFKITQQKVDNDFDVQQAAVNLQATDLIQFNEETIYHGFNRNVNVQSIVYKKGNVLVLIASDQKLPDEIWVGYISSLK